MPDEPRAHRPVGPCGLELTQAGDGWVQGTVPVRDELRRHGGQAHAGVYAAAAEHLAIEGTRAGTGAGAAEMLTCHLSVLRPVSGGQVVLSARARHRGRTTWVWEVECADDRGRVAAAVRVTVALAAP